MNLLQRLGGRKFLLALVVIGIGTAIELHTERGMSVAFATLLASIVAAFSAANFAVSREHFKSGSSGSAELGQDMKAVRNMLQYATNPDNQKAAVDTLQEIRDNLSQLNVMSEHMGQAMVNIANTTQNTQKIVGAQSRVQKEY